MNYKEIIEGLLFVSGDEGITINQIVKVLELNDTEVNNLINQLINDYNDSRGLIIKKFGDNYKMVTKAEHKEFYQKLLDNEIKENLTPSSIEVLAIVAYNQPITRSSIDDIRGVGSDYLVRKLLNKELIKEVGRSDSPGKPRLYGTTNRFLDYMGLENINDLPIIEKIEITEDEEKDLFKSKYNENK